MVFQVDFKNAEGQVIRETVYSADTVREAVEYLVDGTVDWPEGTAQLDLKVVPG